MYLLHAWLLYYRKISSNSSKKRKSGYGKRSRTVDSGDESFGSGTPEVSDGENEDATVSKWFILSHLIHVHLIASEVTA